jgi:hypothetical protein
MVEAKRIHHYAVPPLEKRLISWLKQRRPTTACSDPGRHKVHAPDCIAGFTISAHAPREWRPVADAGRYATLPIVVLALIAALCYLPSAVFGADSGLSEVRAELIEMGRRDQQVRNKPDAQFSPDELRNPPPRVLAYIKEQDDIDAGNLRRLEEIVAEHGWPGSRQFGSEASGAAWLILQHAPLESQEKYLPVLKMAAGVGDARPADVAMLEDRILVRGGRKQRYGTQIVSNAKGNPEVSPVESPENLAELRNSVGLPSMEEYLRRAEADIGIPIGRGNLLAPESK